MLLLTFKILTAPNISFSFYDHLNDLLIVIKCFKPIFVTYSRLSVYYHFISILLARKYQSNNYYRYNITPLHPQFPNVTILCSLATPCQNPPSQAHK